MEDSLLELLCQPSHLLQEVVPVRLGALGLCCWRRRPSQRVPQPSYLSCPLQRGPPLAARAPLLPAAHPPLLASRLLTAPPQHLHMCVMPQNLLDHAPSIGDALLDQYHNHQSLKPQGTRASKFTDCAEQLVRDAPPRVRRLEPEVGREVGGLGPLVELLAFAAPGDESCDGAGCCCSA